MYSLPFVQRYARHHELCYDFRDENLSLKLNEVDLSDTNPTLPDIPLFLAAPTDLPADSKLQLSQRASELLVSATTLPPKPEWKDLVADHVKLRRLKMEPPLLLTDHKKDTKRYLPKQILAIDDIDFSLEALAKEDDEGLYWPSNIRGLCTQWEKQIHNEKPQISKHALKSMRRSLRDDWTQLDHNVLVREALTFKKNLRLTPVFLPLLPEDSSIEPFILSSPALRLRFTSDPVSLNSFPIESPPRGPSYEDYISAKEELPLELSLPTYQTKCSMFEDGDLIGYDAGQPSSSIITEEKADALEDAAVEVKAYNDFAPARSLVSKLNISQLAPYSFLEAHQIPSLPPAESTLPLFDDDKTLRHSPTPRPSQAKQESSPTKVVTFSEQLETIIPSILHGFTQSSDLDHLTESIEGEHYRPPLAQDIIKSQQMLWKPEKLSLLKDSEVDINLVLEFSIEPCELPEKHTLNTGDKTSMQLKNFPQPYQQTHRELPHAVHAKSEGKIMPTRFLSTERHVLPMKRKSLEEIMNETKRQLVASTAMASTFSASGSLSSFLNTRHDKMVTVIEEPKPVQKQTTVLVVGTPEVFDTVTGPKAPFVHRLRSSRTVFFSSGHIHQHQSLLRFFEAWIDDDNLTIIYREMETAMILNPIYGVVITNLQALEQRPLPGQGSGGKSTIHDQVSRLGWASSFEVLFILVSTPASAFSDLTTILSFSAFCKAISRNSTCHLQPIYIPSGEPELQSWIAKLVLEYALHTQDVGFLENTTIWERFLVKAGMNPFAAQYVLGKLKEDGSGRPWGIRAFVQMSPAERDQVFGSTVGSKVLEHVRRRVDGSNLCGELV